MNYSVVRVNQHSAENDGMGPPLVGFWHQNFENSDPQQIQHIQQLDFRGFAETPTHFIMQISCFFVELRISIQLFQQYLLLDLHHCIKMTTFSRIFMVIKRNTKSVARTAFIA